MDRRTVDRDLKRVLAHLRQSIRDSGLTQLEIEEALEWGRGYITQLLYQRKGLRFDQVLQILNVCGVDAATFFDEIYGFDQPHAVTSSRGWPTIGLRPAAQPASTAELLDGLRRTRRLLDAVVTVLTDKQLINAQELDDAVAKAGGRWPDGNPPGDDP